MESLRSVTREVSGSRLFSILALTAFIRCKMDQREIYNVEFHDNLHANFSYKPAYGSAASTGLGIP